MTVRKKKKVRRGKSFLTQLDTSFASFVTITPNSVIDRLLEGQIIVIR